MCVNTEIEKACKKCKLVLNVVENFYTYKKNSNTYRPRCKKCHSSAAYIRRDRPQGQPNPLKKSTTGMLGWRGYPEAKREDIKAAFARGDPTAVVAGKWGVHVRTAFNWMKTCQAIAMDAV